MNEHTTVKQSPDTSGTISRLRIALGFPEWHPFFQVMNNEPADATYVIQGNLARGLMSRGFDLAFMAPINLNDVVYTNDPRQPALASRTWSARSWFNMLSKGAWAIQRLIGVPYLNVFSNLRYYDGFLHALPGIDLVYERNGLYNSGLAMACQRLGIPYVVFFEADQIMELDIVGRPLTGLLRWRARQLLRYNLSVADCVVCVSDVGRQHLVEEWGISAHKIVVFPNAVNVEKFKANAEWRTKIRSQLGLETNPLIIFVGNFFHWHDVVTLLDAFALLVVSHPDARLVLVGDGEQRQAMMQKTDELGLSAMVQFTGAVPHAEVPHYIAAADIAVVPYPPMQQKMWLSPLKLFEYMASGKAIVASSIGQLTDVIQDGENGLLVPPGDVFALAEALKKLIGDAGLNSKLSAQAREDAERKYSWESYLSRLESVFDAVISGKAVNSL
jgi:glycosyltransferase involved in cell wall biosynthesis